MYILSSLFFYFIIFYSHGIKYQKSILSPIVAINFISGKPSLSWTYIHTHTLVRPEIFRELKKNTACIYCILWSVSVCMCVWVFRDLDNKALLYSIKILLILYRFEIDNYFIYTHIYIDYRVRIGAYYICIDIYLLYIICMCFKHTHFF